MTHAGPPPDGTHAGGRVVIVDRTDGAPAAHGLARFEAALDSAGTDAERVDRWTATDRGTVLVAGTTDGGPVERLLADAAVAVPDRPESLVCAWRPTASADGTDGGHALVVGGTDGRRRLLGRGGDPGGPAGGPYRPPDRRRRGPPAGTARETRSTTRSDTSRRPDRGPTGTPPGATAPR